MNAIQTVEWLLYIIGPIIRNENRCELLGKYVEDYGFFYIDRVVCICHTYLDEFRVWLNRIYHHQ